MYSSFVFVLISEASPYFGEKRNAQGPGNRQDSATSTYHAGREKRTTQAAALSVSAGLQAL
jgi:hypothetical protein